MMVKDAYETLLHEYMSCVDHCDECVAEEYCRKHDLRIMKSAEGCVENLRKYFKDR